MEIRTSTCNQAGYLPDGLSPSAVTGMADPFWLGLHEIYSGLKSRPLHHLACRKGSAIGFLPGYLEQESLCSTFMERLFGRLATVDSFRTKGNANTLTCAVPWSFYSGAACLPAEADAAHGALLDAVDATAVQMGFYATAFPYVAETDALLRKHLTSSGYLSFPNCPTTVLDLEGYSFADYIRNLRSSNARSMVRREWKKAHRMAIQWVEGVKPNRTIDGVPLIDDLMRLFENTWNKHNPTYSLLTKRLLHEIWSRDQKDQQDLRVCLALDSGKPAAFSLIRLSGDTAHLLMVGRDYHLPESIPYYFSVMFYEPISRGFQEGWKRIHYRPGSYQAKIRRGCRLERLYLYVKIYHPVLRALLPIYMRLSAGHFRRKYLPPQLFRR